MATRKPTGQKWDRIVYAASLYLIGARTNAEIAEACSVNERTFYRWRSQPWWQDALDAGHTAAGGELDAAAIASLHKNMRAGDVQTTLFYAARRWPSRFGEGPTRLEVSGRVEMDHAAILTERLLKIRNARVAEEEAEAEQETRALPPPGWSRRRESEPTTESEDDNHE